MSFAENYNDRSLTYNIRSYYAPHSGYGRNLAAQHIDPMLLIYKTTEFDGGARSEERCFSYGVKPPTQRAMRTRRELAHYCARDL